MSQELHFVEIEPAKWFYILEQPNAPKDAWDWMEYADAFGPFNDLGEAEDHEYKGQSDTSGATIFEHKDIARVSDSARCLIDKARPDPSALPLARGR